MSGLNKSEIRVGTLDQTQVIGAALFTDDPTATMPSMADMDVTEKWTGLGYLVEDGFTVALGQTATGIKEHNLGYVKMIDAGEEKSITLTVMQTNADNLAIVVGDEHVETGAATTTHGALLKAEFGRWVGKQGALQVRLKDGDAYGVWLMPTCQLMECNEIEVNASGVMGWSMKFVPLAEPGQPEIVFLSDDGVVTA